MSLQYYGRERGGKKISELCPNNPEITEKQRHHFANKGPSRQGYGFSSGHVWM